MPLYYLKKTALLACSVAFTLYGIMINDPFFMGVGVFLFCYWLSDGVFAI
jgi:hypothetical protein